MHQLQALKVLKEGRNVFLTGAAGSGKTYVLNQYIDFLKEQKIKVGITASTGIAATHIGGLTIHSWSGVGINEILTDSQITELIAKPYISTRIKSAGVLIIDEVSMLHSHLLDMVDLVCRRVRGDSSPFGGLQVVMCGDFFQLPPVNKNSQEYNFAWKADVWNNMDLRICYLDEQYRQSDPTLLDILNQIRNRQVDEYTLEKLSTRYKQKIVGFTKPTKLFTHNFDVDTTNDLELTKLRNKPHVFQMTGTGHERLVETLIKNCLAPQVLTLKKGALVMFVKNNFDLGYVNGTLGEVVGFDEDGYPKVQVASGDIIIATPVDWSVEDNNTNLATINQIPLRLAWAITVHKSQGMSLDAAQIDLSKSFVPGMGYVALSRVRTLSGLNLTGFNQMAYQVNDEVLEIDQYFKTQSASSNLLKKGSPETKSSQQ